MFNYSLSDLLQQKVKKLVKKDKKRSEILYKKINKIINSEIKDIDHYKNLRYELKNYKRVHIDNHFVLVFKVLKKYKIILFINFKNKNKMIIYVNSFVVF
jgi:mRNA-degrading endonuclease RelE of RelBE toxin-antitoxin system